MPICYLNTDLDLTAPRDLTPLAAALKIHGVRALHVTAGDDGLWYAIFETDEQFQEPEPNIAAMLTAIESLSESALDDWRSCTCREFNIGYDCGSEPWAFNQGLSADTLRRTAAAATSLRITLYPPTAGEEAVPAPQA